MSLTEISIKRPLLITVVFVVLVLFGFISYSNLNYNLLPKFEANVLSISTIYPGASPREVETNITKPVEDAVSAIEGIDKITSTSQEGFSLVLITLKPGISTITAQRDAERKIGQITSLLPQDIDDPVVNRFNTEELPVLRISATANLSPTELYNLLDNQIKPILSNVKGVGTVRLIGGTEREIQVSLDNDKLHAYNFSPAQVSQLIGQANSSYPAGNVQTSGTRLSIQFDARLSRVEELRNLILRENADGSKVFLRDVASISDGQQEITALNRINGKAGVGVEIVKQADANAVEVSQKVKATLADLKTQFAAQGLNYEIAMDQSTYTLQSANGVLEDLTLAVFIVAAVMLMFLHSLRSSTFVLVALPSAMIPTFILMNVFGFSLNLMTLMALSLVVGILVDDSIVVLENIYRHLEMGKDKQTAALEGRNEIGFTAVAITLVDVVVFVPLALSTGLIGNILREFALVVVFSTLMSLLVAFTLTPMLASRWGRVEHLRQDSLWGKISLGFERLLDTIKEEYGKILRWSLGHKRYILLGITLLFIGTFALLPAGFIGTAFVSNSDRGEFNIQLEVAPQSSLYETNQATLQIEKILLAHPEVTTVFTSVGTQSGVMGGSSSSANLAEISVKMVDKETRKISQDDFSVVVRDEILKVPGVKATIIPTSITGSSQSPIQIAVKSADTDQLWPIAQKVAEAVRSTAGTDYIQFSTKSPRPQIEIQLDREKVARHGLSVPEVGAAVQLAFRGNDRSKFREEGEEYAINIELDPSDKQDIASVRSLVLRNQQGVVVRLDEIANVYETVGQSVLERTDRLNSIKITASATGRPMGDINSEIQAKIDQINMPAGVGVEMLGQAQQQSDAFGSLGFALLLALVLVYLVMVALYESMVYPFVVMFSIPVALIGALLALALSMQELTIFAIIGLIMLMGLVAKNGILIVDFTNHLKAQGLSLVEALVEAGKERLRPILMTTFAMIAGMLPIALANGAGAEVKNGMAWVVIGGLTSSLLLTLLLVPTMYYLIEKLRIRVNRWFAPREKKQTPELAEV
ncbi:MAG: efflux RND transporter permease subunit [Bacteroidia bacterium]